MNSPLSGTSTLRSGKETKDRRNRERLLQGPGSEFSLTNPETDMELDYYDYNVANAGAAPGSYLGMDPAFLLWIPPLSMSEDSQDPSADRPDCFQGTTTSPALYRLPESTEGATLTPAEYRRMRHQIASSIEETRPSLEQQRQDSTSSSSSKNDSSSGGSVLSEDSISENRTAKLTERLLPIHRILEDSRTRVSEESLCSQLTIERTQCINRLHGTKSDLSQEQNASRSGRQDSYINIADSVVMKSEEKSRQASKKHPEDVVLHHGTSRSYVNQKTKDVSQSDKRNRCFKNENTSKFSSKSTSSKTQGYVDGKDRDLQSAKDDPRSDIILTNLNVSGPCKYRDFTQFTQPHEINKLSDCTNIPMIEFSGPRLNSPATARKLTTDNLNISLSKKEIQSPDYGVESDMKTESRDSFYDLIRENEEGIKFADDDDEYIDNRANLWNLCCNCYIWERNKDHCYFMTENVVSIRHFKRIWRDTFWQVKHCYLVTMWIFLNLLLCTAEWYNITNVLLLPVTG